MTTPLQQERVPLDGGAPLGSLTRLLFRAAAPARAGLLLEVLSGTAAGTSLALSAPLSVGAGRKNDLVLRDERVQFEHARLDPTGALEVLTPLHTALDGVPVRKGRYPLPAGSRIDLGGVTLRVSAPPSAARGWPAFLYDAHAAGERGAWPDARPLEGGRELRGPCLRRLGDPERLAETLVDWPAPWGIYLLVTAGEADLADRLVGWRRARVGRKREKVLRLHDPRVAARVLPTLDARQTATLFGAEVGAAILADGDELLVLRPQVAPAPPRPLTLRADQLRACGLEPLPPEVGCGRAWQEPVAARLPLELVVEARDGEVRAGRVRGARRGVLRLGGDAGDEWVTRPEERAAVTLTQGPVLELRRELPLRVEPVEERGAPLLACLRRDGRAYALLSGAALPDEVLDALRPRARALPARVAPVDADKVGYLLELGDDAESERLASEGLAEGWCSLWTTPAGPEALLRHLRRLGRVEDGRAGDALQLRLAPPGTLRALLPALTPGGVAALFGCAARALPTCPLCEEPGAATVCAWCAARFADGRLVGRIVVPDDPTRCLECRPAPGLTHPGWPLVLEADAIAALGDLYAWRSGAPARSVELAARAGREFPARAAAAGAGWGALIAGLVDRATAYGLWGDEAQRDFVRAALLVDPEFELRPWAWTWLEILHGEGPPDERAARLWELAQGEAEGARGGVQGG